MPTTDDIVNLKVTPDRAGQRLDQYLAAACQRPRHQAATQIKAGLIRVNGRLVKPAYPVKNDDLVSGHFPETFCPDLTPTDLSLDIRFEDDHLLIINKPPGLVTHPAPGHPADTLVNGLVHHFPPLGRVGAADRPGIVHRLDKDTSGVMVAAKTASAYDGLLQMFQDRRIHKTYLALVHGKMDDPAGTITAPIGRHAIKRQKMSTTGSKNPKPAETHWLRQRLYSDASLLRIVLTTGRTHQIRVHCAASQHPVVGDPVYGARWCGKKENFSNAAAFRLLQAVPRQMLHAWRLAFAHPVTGAPLAVTVPLPGDMAGVLRQLRQLAWTPGHGSV